MKKFVLKNCRLVKALTEGYDQQTADILIENDKIAAIRPVGFDFGQVEAIDAHNQTLLPGLIDLHMHFIFVDQDYPAMLQRSPYAYILDCVSHARVLMQQGYTTARDCGNESGAVAVLRDYIDRGVIQGPRIITSGHCITPTTPGNSTFGALYKLLDKPEDAMRVCREDLELGADFIKLMATGSVMNVGGEPGALIATPEEIKALCDAAAFNNTYVAAHAHGKQAILECIKAGVRTIEHGSFLDEEVIEAVLAKKGEVAIIPTYAVAYALLNNLSGDVPGELIQKEKAIMESYGPMGKLAYERGVPIGWGSDIDEEIREKYVGLEFIARAEQGFDAIGLLRQATIESAKILHMEDQIGTIKEGKQADMLLIDGNPDEDIYVMQKLPTRVFKAGVEYCG